MTKRYLALLLLLASCSGGPERVVEPRLTDQPAPRGEALLRRAMLDGQNAARAGVGVAPLVWDDRLAADALAYAETMARTGRFEHAAQPQGPGREGGEPVDRHARGLQLCRDGWALGRGAAGLHQWRHARFQPHGQLT